MKHNEAQSFFPLRKAPLAPQGSAVLSFWFLAPGWAGVHAISHTALASTAPAQPAFAGEL